VSRNRKVHGQRPGEWVHGLLVQFSTPLRQVTKQSSWDLVVMARHTVRVRLIGSLKQLLRVDTKLFERDFCKFTAAKLCQSRDLEHGKCPLTMP